MIETFMIFALIAFAFTLPWTYPAFHTWMNLRGGYCPLCDSSPPMPPCPICHGSRDYGPHISQTQRKLVQSRWRAWKNKTL
jgi:hypothetical protein